MELLTRPQGHSLPLLPLMAGAAGVAIALLVATLPAPLFEGLVLASGLPAFLSVAEPPLGLTARLLVFVALAAGIACVLTAGLWPVLGKRRLRVRGSGKAMRRPSLKQVRARLSGEPADAPDPRPISAREELGAPFLSVKAQPAAVDIDATVVPVAQPVPQLAAPAPKPAPRPQPSRSQLPAAEDLSALLGRLEGGLARRASPRLRPMLGSDAARVREMLSALDRMPRAS